MARMSNRDRIAHAAEEARLAAEEKEAKKQAKKQAKKVTKAPSKPRAKKEVRMKIVWVVYSGGKSGATFAYPDKDAGTAEAQRLSVATGRIHELRAIKVPMD